jgi:hypothetical protein
MNEINTRIYIPGYQTNEASETEAGAETEIAGQEHGRLNPSPTPEFDLNLREDWKDSFGLNQVAPDPTRIDPPMRPATFEGGAARNTLVNFDFQGGGSSGMTDNLSSAPKVDRMLKFLASSQEAMRQIRARASNGGQRV